MSCPDIGCHQNQEISMKDTIRYSESFKQKVVNEIAKGKFISCTEASQAYGISGSCTVRDWVKKYGRTDLLPRVIRDFSSIRA